MADSTPVPPRVCPGDGSLAIYRMGCKADWTLHLAAISAKARQSEQIPACSSERRPNGYARWFQYCCPSTSTPSIQVTNRFTVFFSLAANDHGSECILSSVTGRVIPLLTGSEYVSTVSSVSSLLILSTFSS